MSTTITQPRLTAIREQFPALRDGFAFLENAGGTQVPKCVVDAISSYLITSNAQLGAGYPASVAATEALEAARAFGRTFMNGEKKGQVIFGASSSALCQMLANAYAEVLSPGDEIIVMENGHEANIGPWFKLDKHGIKTRVWRIDKKTHVQNLDQLKDLLNEKTRIVAVTHVSNLLGQIEDVRSISDLAHQYGARVVVDGVAFAPHRAIDVQALGADWYVFSAYKVFGPHLAVLYGGGAAADITGPNHFFILRGSASKFELGCLAHELVAGFVGIGDYLRFLTGDEVFSRDTVTRAFDLMTALELETQARLLDFLNSKNSVRTIGPTQADGNRVGTISFVHDKLTPQEIVAHVDKSGIGIRYGHMYAFRLCQALGLNVDSGVVRVSMVHYNTNDEIDRLIGVLDGIL